MNKTNQFNLTTKRYELAQMQAILDDASKRVYLFRVEDRFGDYGIVAALIVDLWEEPTITDFVMSCRIMGKNIEYGILTIVEDDLRTYDKLMGLYIPTVKNKPVEKLYEKAGYRYVGKQSERNLYELDRPLREAREFYLEIL